MRHLVVLLNKVYQKIKYQERLDETHLGKYDMTLPLVARVAQFGELSLCFVSLIIKKKRFSRT